MVTSSAKAAADRFADTGPVAYRTQEHQVLSVAAAQASGEEKLGLAAFRGHQARIGQGVRTRQLSAKEKDELDRKAVIDQIQRIYNRVKKDVDDKLTTLENWGRRQLAYTVSKFRRGVYVYVRYLGGGALVNEVERNLRMLKEDVLKFQTVQVAQDIDFGSVEVRAESVKFEAVEPATPEELAEPIERLLGLEEAPERERPPAPDEDEFEVPPEIEGGGNVS